MINPQQAYINSFIHYRDKEYRKINDDDKVIYTYLLDKRFLKTKDLYELEKYFQYCKLKNLDDYYFMIYTLFPLNQSKLFYLLLDKDIILSIQEFIKLVE